MSEHRFTASELVAITFLREKVLAEATTDWLTPTTWNFDWFTRISSTNIVVTETTGNTQLLERTISFYLGKNLVAELKMHGERRQPTTERPTPMSYWAVIHIRYALEWGGHIHTTWVERETNSRSVTAPCWAATND